MRRPSLKRRLSGAFWAAVTPTVARENSKPAVFQQTQTRCSRECHATNRGTWQEHEGRHTPWSRRMSSCRKSTCADGLSRSPEGCTRSIPIEKAPADNAGPKDVGNL